jgi:hypothetical protein
MFRLMRRRHQGLILGISAVVLAGACLQAGADVKENPYDSILKRNPFRLNPPPPPPPPPDMSASPPPPPPATVELTGITTILNHKKVLLEIVPGPGKPMVRPVMTEGERFESIEVVSINVEKSEVTIKNGPLVTNLTFRVAKPSATVATGPVPSGLAQPVVPPPAFVPPPQTSAFNPGGRNNVMVAGGNSAPAAPANNFGGANPAYNPAAAAAAPGMNNPGDPLRSIPSRNIRTTTPQGEISREQQYLMMEVNREVNKNNPHPLPPLPPTPLNPNPNYPPIP